MPYYMGDYYVGDPGFFSFLGGLAKAALPAIPVVGAPLSKVVEGISAGRAARAALPAAAGLATAARPSLRGALAGAKATALKHPVLTGAGAAGIVGAGAALAGAKLEKRMLMHKKHRRMRATNTKALRRALRRAYAFERIAMRTIHLIHPRKRARFGGFRKRKRVC